MLHILEQIYVYLVISYCLILRKTRFFTIFENKEEKFNRCLGVMFSEAFFRADFKSEIRSSKKFAVLFLLKNLVFSNTIFLVKN